MCKGIRPFIYSDLKDQKWDSDILGLAAIYKETGKQQLYLKQRPEELENLVEIAKIQSTEASYAIPLSQNHILQLHKIMYSHMNNPMAVKTKNTQNYISAKYPNGHVEALPSLFYHATF